VVETWATQYPERLASSQVDTVQLPLPGLSLLDRISGYEYAILVDAVLGGPGVSPGSLLFLSPQDLPAFSRGAGSAHGWGVAESLKLADTLGREDMPEEIVILGIGGKQVEVGKLLSPEVAAALPEAVTALDQLIQRRLG
jgi:hydrogenase maturation protease